MCIRDRSVSLVDVFDDEIHVVDSPVYSLAVVDGGVYFLVVVLLIWCVSFFCVEMFSVFLWIENRIS